MKPLTWALAPFVVAVVFFVSGCSLAVFVRVFNQTDHAIKLLGSGGDAPIDIPSGQNARVLLTSITRGRDHGFAIQDGGVERFYVASSHSADGQLVYPPALAFPHVMRKSKQMAPEYFVEYSADSTIFALDASDEVAPKRLDPQPTGFPLRPNQALEHNDPSRHASCCAPVVPTGIVAQL
jgi:hypothetical protein